MRAAPVDAQPRCEREVEVSVDRCPRRSVRSDTVTSMNAPEDASYSSDHEWVRVEAGLARIGLTDYAQDALGDIVFIELPAVGAAVTANQSISEVESTKSVSDIYAPVSGTVVEVNSDLEDAPESLNDDPYGDGWICVIEMSEPSEFEALMDASAYLELTAE